MLTILVSVWDKTGLPELLQKLQEHEELNLIATSSTKSFLLDHGFDCMAVEDITGFPEILGGRVKTLHPHVFAGILARPIKEDDEALKRHGINRVDMVIVSLYPFEQKLQQRLPEKEMIEFIDIGGVSLLRAAAKNHECVAVVCERDQYPMVAKEYSQNGGKLTLELKKKLAWQAFEHTAAYDRQIANFFAQKVGHSIPVAAKVQAQEESSPALPLPGSVDLHLQEYQQLRYGENPHQAAVWYSNGRFERDAGGLESFPPFEQLQGKELSSNNITDTYCLVRILREIGGPSSCIIKHNNPCGVAVGTDVMDAFEKAYSTDPSAAFGGIFGFTETVTGALAKRINEGFVEIVAAPAFDEEALEAFKKKKNVRVLQLKSALLKQSEYTPWHVRDLQDFGFILERDLEPPVQLAQFQSVTGKLAGEHIADASFAWAVVKHLTSNAIFLAKGQRSIGFGIGQTSRIASVKIALEQAGKEAGGAVMASDAFFPAIDNIEAAAEAGIAVIVQPGGSIKDKEVIEACEKAGITMLLTGQRCFKH
ncbi:MAG TPA: bifunctional phosphoribosylaminoimidazolecarboxamide formyltransferase/IMP cyclohydrolase [Planktothrix sp.]|jgi:phosphoribosylaminoimidazolecarboxamide formyltransferase/IMP cyclohydrolase